MDMGSRSRKKWPNVAETQPTGDAAILPGGVTNRRRHHNHGDALQNTAENAMSCPVQSSAHFPPFPQTLVKDWKIKFSWVSAVPAAAAAAAATADDALACVLHTDEEVGPRFGPLIKASYLARLLRHLVGRQCTSSRTAIFLWVWTHVHSKRVGLICPEGHSEITYKGICMITRSTARLDF